MSACPHYQETLWLDVYAELEAPVRAEWEAHLAECVACREERARMVRMIDAVKKTMRPPLMETPVANAMVAAIRRKLNPSSRTAWWRPRIGGRPLGWVPALAACALLIIAVGVVSYQMLNSPAKVTALAPDDGQGQVMMADMELLKHMDLLLEMDSVQKLVQVIDMADSPAPEQPYRDNTQGNNVHERHNAYV